MLVSVRIFFDDNLPGEGAINEGEISGREEHADDPPDEPDPQSIVRCYCAVYRKRVDRIACGKNHGEDAEDDAGEHAGDVQARAEESLAFVVLDQLELHAYETRDREQRQNHT